MPRFSIVGQKHLGLDPYLSGTPAGITAMLVREPNNPYDAFAVAVYISGKKVGFLGKRDNVDIAKLIDAQGAEVPAGFAMDSKPTAQTRMMPVTFVRSPNTSYPQVEIDS